MKFNTPFNYRYDERIPGRYEVNNLPSETIPDDTMSVREIFQRYANGQSLTGNGRMIMPDEVKAAIPLNWDTLDISEKYEFAAQHNVKLTEMEKAFKAKREEEDDKTYRELIIAEYEASKKPEKPVSNEEGNKNP